MLFSAWKEYILEKLKNLTLNLLFFKTALNNLWYQSASENHINFATKCNKFGLGYKEFFRTYTDDLAANHCKAYDGFRYYTFNNNLNDLIYSDEIINHNLDLCLKKITIPTNILKKELELILNEK